MPDHTWSDHENHFKPRWCVLSVGGSLWCPAPPGVQEEMVSAEPMRFFAPPTSASGVFSGWLGVYLDTSGRHKVDWVEIAAIVEDAFRHIAPKALVTELDNRAR